MCWKLEICYCWNFIFQYGTAEQSFEGYVGVRTKIHLPKESRGDITGPESARGSASTRDTIGPESARESARARASAKRRIGSPTIT